MKYIPSTKTLELSERNVKTLLAKLDDDSSSRTLVDPDRLITVTALEDIDYAATIGKKDRIILSRSMLDDIKSGEGLLTDDGYTVIGVSDETHYSNRNPGPVYMPGSGHTF